MSQNLYWHSNKLSFNERRNLFKHDSLCLWFTGLSGSGKSTLAVEVEYALFKMNIHSYILDGDNIRHGLNKDLNFTEEDRKENIRRIGEVVKLFVDSGLIVLTAFISPYQTDRNNVRKLLPQNKFIEIYVDCDLKTCEERDAKGLYSKARKGEIDNFTGISSPYEIPTNPELIVKNSFGANLENNVKIIIDYLIKRGLVNPNI